MRLLVGISGSSGAIYGVRLLEVLRDLPEVESHLVITGGARRTISYETDYTPEMVESMADMVYEEGDLAAGPASGTFLTEGMVVAPCSIKSASAIAHSHSDNLLVRAADVCLKEGRRLVLVVRETPLHAGHLRMLAGLAEIGAVILPPVPGFYVRPRDIGALVDHTITKVLDQFGIEANLIDRWKGPNDF